MIAFDLWADYSLLSKILDVKKFFTLGLYFSIMELTSIDISAVSFGLFLIFLKFPT